MIKIKIDGKKLQRQVDEAILNGTIRISNDFEKEKTMISKREAAEMILKNGWSALHCRNECPFFNNSCNGATAIREESNCKETCSTYLTDNPESNEWQELDLNNPPEDIVIKDKYDVEVMKCGQWFNIKNFTGDVSVGCKYRFRKRQQKAVSHEDIMTLWWDIGGEWFKVNGYRAEYGDYSFNNGKMFTDREWFTDRQSATIPPESSC